MESNSFILAVHSLFDIKAITRGGREITHTSRVEGDAIHESQMSTAASDVHQMAP